MPTKEEIESLDHNLGERDIDRIESNVESGTSGCAGAPVPIRTDDLRWMIWATRQCRKILAAYIDEKDRREKAEQERDEKIDSRRIADAHSWEIHGVIKDLKAKLEIDKSHIEATLLERVRIAEKELHDLQGFMRMDPDAPCSAPHSPSCGCWACIRRGACETMQKERDTIALETMRKAAAIVREGSSKVAYSFGVGAAAALDNAAARIDNVAMEMEELAK